MTDAIFKYYIPLQDQVDVFFPVGAEILHLGTQGTYKSLDHPKVWAKVSIDATVLEKRSFRWYGTGHKILAGSRYIGTIIYSDVGSVYHLFEDTHLPID